MRCAQKVLSDGSDLSTVGDGNGAVVSVSVVVAWLLVVLKTLHQGHEV